MNLIIIDDEKHVRKSLMLLIDWHALGFNTILEAQDGDDAIALMTNWQPDMIIMDIMMPHKSGLELMDWLQLHQVRSEVIVISGYDDFDFVRHTLKHGAVDYLLKPINPIHLRDAVNKSLQRRMKAFSEERERNDLAVMVRELKPVYWGKLLSDLIDGDPLHVENAAIHEFKPLCPLGLCRVAVTISQWLDESGGHCISTAFIDHCNASLSQNTGYAYRNSYNSHEIIIVFWNKLEQAPAQLLQLTRTFWDAYGIQWEFGLGEAASFPDGLPQSFHQAAVALRNGSLLPKTELGIHRFQPGDEGLPYRLRFGEYKNGLELAVRSGNSEQIRLAIDDWIQYLNNQPKMTVAQYRWWTEEFHFTIGKWMEELAGKKINDLFKYSLTVPYEKDRSFSLRLLREQLIYILGHLSREIIEHQSTTNNIMQEIENYIKQHYREVSLADISARFHLNREHISRRFKQQFGITIVNYISEIRIEKAKVLLVNPQLKVADIGISVGYEDEKYFSRVFKKLTGLSPKEYRVLHIKDSLSSAPDPHLLHRS